MNIEFIDTESEDFLCDRFRVSGKPSTEQILKQLAELENDNHGFRFLLTLDDIGQACYTSMHSKMSYDLDETDGYDLSILPSNCFEDGEHKGYLTVKEEFFIRKGNFEKQLQKISFEDVCSKGVSLFNQDQDDGIESFKYDLSTLIDNEFHILKVPTENSYEAIYAFPNGYFSCDLSPLENAFLSKLLFEKFGYDLIGLGASYLAFRKGREIIEQQCISLIEILNKIYRDDFNSELKEELSESLSNNQILILKYTE